MDNQLICPVCETTYNKDIRFCSECGCNLSQVKAVTVKPSSGATSSINSLKSQAQDFGQKAQKSVSGASSVILDRASNVSTGTDNVLVQRKVSEAMASLVNMMINVSHDVKKGISTDMVNAVDLSARVNFVAFSIGVSIDLATLNKPKTEMKEMSDSSVEV